MKISLRLVVCMVAASLPALAAQAQDRPYPTGCAPQPPGSAPSDAPRIIGVQDPSPKTLYGPGDSVIVNAGTARDVHVGQRYYVRRHVTSRLVQGPQPIVTTGGLRIIAANDSMAIGLIDLGCDGMHPGDYLEPAPSSLEQDNRVAETDLDFSSPSRVLYGDYGKMNGANGDVMFADLGSGVEPGARYAVYRDVNVPGVPLAPVGEAVVVSIGENASLIRVTKVRDSVNSGDLLIPRKK
jgi:hypothetical protein